MAVLPVVFLAGGCGQDVATCDTICTTSGTCTATVLASCTSSCTSYQATCTANVNAGGDFQQLLTCIGDSNDACNGFASIPPLCAGEAAAVTAACGPLPN
jgi:hypothetical protein